LRKEEAGSDKKKVVSSGETWGRKEWGGSGWGGTWGTNISGGGQCRKTTQASRTVPEQKTKREKKGLNGGARKKVEASPSYRGILNHANGERQKKTVELINTWGSLLSSVRSVRQESEVKQILSSGPKVLEEERGRRIERLRKKS